MRKLLLCLYLIVGLLSGCSNDVSSKLDVKILDQKVQYGNSDVLYQIPNSIIEKGTMQSFCRYQDYLLSAYFTYDSDNNISLYNIHLISVETGELVKKVSLEELESPVIQVNDNYIGVKDQLTGKYMIFDNELNMIKDYQFKVGDTYMNKDASILYSFNDDEGIRVLEGDKESVFLKNAGYVNVISNYDDIICFTYFNKDTLLEEYGVLNLDTGKIDIFDTDYSLMNMESNGNVFIANLAGEGNTYLFMNNNDKKYFKLSHTYSAIELQENDYISVESFGDESIEIDLYDLNGNYISGIDISDVVSAPLDRLVWFEECNGYFFTLSNNKGLESLCFWDLSEKQEGEDMEFLDDIYASDSRINDIFNKYGVKVNIGESVKTEYYEHHADIVTNETIINKALDNIEVGLSSFPEDFFRQLRYSNYRYIEINLTGSIYNNDISTSYSDGTVNGLTEEGMGKQVIALDINKDGMKQTFYHEISHAIDGKIIFASVYINKLKDYEKGWEDLNQKDFSYPMRYYDLPMSIYEEKYLDDFVDFYSMTFPTEDRARLFENIMMGNNEVFDKYPVRIKKLRYYSECIRKVFDTSNWKNVEKWEGV
ncbi:MAG: hypothetical protein U0L85_03185 [Bacilli bacterium]|nr:hypothetical protein [Bacilli bacterium]